MLNKFFKNKKIETAKEAVKNNPENILMLSILGKLYLEDNFYNEAISVFEKILKLDEKYLPALENLSKCYILKKDYLKGYRTLKYLCLLVPDDTHAKTMLFSLENAPCEIEVKIEILKGLLEIKNSEELKEKLANKYAESGQFAKSAELFEDLLGRNENSVYLKKLGEIYTKTRKNISAIGIYERLMMTDDFTAEFAQKLAELYVLEQRFEEAKGIFELLIQTLPENAKFYNEEIAKILLQEQNPDQAIEVTQNIIDEDKYSVEGKFLQAKALIEKKEYAEAVSFLREFYYDPVDKKIEKKIEEEIIKTSILYARELRNQRKFVDAIDALTPALRYDENNKEVYVELANISRDIKDFEAANEYMKIAENL